MPSGFTVRKDAYPGQTDFDKYYENKTVKQICKKTGEGEDDFILELKEVIEKVDIKKSIDAQLPDAGIEAYMRPYLQTGEPLPDIGFEDVEKAPINDFSELPEDIGSAMKLGEDAQKLFSELDPELVGDRDFQEFCKTVTPDEIKSYLKNKYHKVEDKESKSDNKKEMKEGEN